MMDTIEYVSIVGWYIWIGAIDHKLRTGLEIWTWEIDH